MTKGHLTYRYLLDPEPPAYGRFGRGIRWGFLFAALLWLLIFAIGFLVTRT